MEWTVFLIAIFITLILVTALQKEKNSSTQVSFQDLKKKGEERKKLIDQERKANPSKPSLPRIIHTEVKGTYYRTSDEKAAARNVEKGDTLILKVEPENQVDKNAVRYHTLSGSHIGYVESNLSKFVRDNLSHVKSCIVTNVSNHAIPYIDVVINFSSMECRQKDFLDEDLRVTPEDRMRDIAKGINREYKYRHVSLRVSGTYEYPLSVIKKAKSLRNGDKVVLKKPETESEFYPYRIDVYTEDGIMIGFCYGSFAKEPYDMFDKIKHAMVDSIMDSETDAVCIYIYIPQNTSHEEPIISTEGGHYYSGPYPQIAAAAALKNTDQEKALELALPIAMKEKGIDAKFLCCQIYRIQKNYELERKMILKILERIDNISPEEISKSDYFYIKRQADTILKRLNTVESRLQSKYRKKS